MELNYSKLWSLLKANKMKKGELYKAAGITQSVARKLNHNEPVNLAVVMNICKVFHCDICDVVEIIEL